MLWKRKIWKTHHFRRRDLGVFGIVSVEVAQEKELVDGAAVTDTCLGG